MLGKRDEIAWLQSDFYRDQYRKMLRWILVCVFLMLVLILSLIYLILFKPKEPYYANTTDGKILLMPASKQE